MLYINNENFRRNKFSVENLTEGFFAENIPFTRCDREFVTLKILEKWFFALEILISEINSF